MMLGHALDLKRRISVNKERNFKLMKRISRFTYAYALSPLIALVVSLLVFRF